MDDTEPLERYRQKRDFDRTSEPRGGSIESGSQRFVVQKHAARRLHYDVRFEVDGVLASWAVPKGPSYNPKTKRLAMHVEDHPLEYRTFEGIIPGGAYGAGAVIVWDEGTYRNLTEKYGNTVPVRQAIEAGHLSVWLDGTKLRGGWSLTRTGQAGRDAWIMVKRSDEQADPTLDIEASSPDSVTTGQSLEQVAATRGAAGADTVAAVAATRGAAGADTVAAVAATRGVAGAAAVAGAAGAAGNRSRTGGPATWRPPMLAESMKPEAHRVGVDGDDWLYERKLDGLRCLAVRNGDATELWSRNHLSFNRRFPELVSAVASLPVDNFVLDGEIVAFDGERTSFSLLQRSEPDTRPVLCVFDVLHLLGQDTTTLPLGDRKRLVAQLLAGAGQPVQPVTGVTGDPGELLSTACASGWEGLIAKRTSSPYLSGRSTNWRKLKCTASQELVIGGWTEPKGTRQGFGSLLVGYYDDDGLRYAGKVGTGFDAKLLRDLHGELQRRERETAPFDDPVQEKQVHWAAPDLVANIGFSEWTPDGKLRHPRFEGLRTDKPATDVRREDPAG